jgi:uncharacterized membrane protein AbrB (regulator of aidB expression)
VTMHRIAAPDQPAAPAAALDRSPLDAVVYVQNWENARHLRLTRVTSASAFAVIIAACLATLQAARADRFIEITLLGFLVVVALIQLLIGLELKRELDDCMECIARQVQGRELGQQVAMLNLAGSKRPWHQVRWLYTAFYAATLTALAAALIHRVLT